MPKYTREQIQDKLRAGHVDAAALRLAGLSPAATPGGPSERERHDAEPGPDGSCLVCGSRLRRYYLHK